MEAALVTSTELLWFDVVRDSSSETGQNNGTNRTCDVTLTLQYGISSMDTGLAGSGGFSICRGLGDSSPEGNSGSGSSTSSSGFESSSRAGSAFHSWYGSIMRDPWIRSNETGHQNSFPEKLRNSMRTYFE